MQSRHAIADHTCEARKPHTRRCEALIRAAGCVTLVGVHWQYGFSSVRLVELTSSGARFARVGYELALVYLAALAALAIGEPTTWSVDRWRLRANDL